MKKLAIAQIILGMLIIGSLVYWAGWLSEGYHNHRWISPDGIIFNWMPLLRPNPALNVWLVLHPALGLAVLACGVAQFFRPRSARLAIIQIILGTLVICSLVWFIGWAEWDYGPYTRVMEPYGEIEMKNLPGWEMRLIIWKVTSFIISAGVICTGIVQKTKAGRNETDD